MQKIHKLKNIFEQLNQLSLTKTHPSTMFLLRAAVSLWILVGNWMLIPAAQQFYSISSHIPLQNTTDMRWALYLNILNMTEYNFLYPTFIFAQVVFALMAGFSFWPRISSLLLYWTTLNLDNRAYAIMDGGNNLMHLILFYLIFINPWTNNSKKSWWRTLDHLSSNLSLYMCRIQVALVYMTAGLLKASGPLWTKGIALYYTMNVIEYGNPLLAKLMSTWPLMTVLATYGTLLFQLSFPFLIWSRKTRPLYLMMGTLLHLQIAFVMGLFLFGLAMCVSYVSFYTEQRSQHILQILRSHKNNLLLRWREKKIYAAY